MTIDINLFNTFLPASRGSSWNKLEAFADLAESRLRNQFFGDAAVDHFKTLTTESVTGKMFARILTNLAYFEAVPFVDLIQTDTGFAIVSNSNMAPASKERVAAVREASRTVAYTGISELLSGILKDASLREMWLSSPASDRFTDGIVWVPADMETAPFGADRLIEELADIRAAERYVAEYVSQELIEKIVENRRENALSRKDLTLYALIVRAVTARFQNRGSRDLGLLIDYLNRHAREYPAYAQSDACKANNWKEAPESESDTCFFMTGGLCR